jgi:hypothetical protein
MNQREPLMKLHDLLMNQQADWLEKQASRQLESSSKPPTDCKLNCTFPRIPLFRSKPGSYRSSFVATVLCTVASVAMCVAQSTTTFGVVTTNDSTSTLSGWTPRSLYTVDVNNDGIPDLIQDQD